MAALTFTENSGKIGACTCSEYQAFPLLRLEGLGTRLTLYASWDHIISNLPVAGVVDVRRLLVSKITFASTLISPVLLIKKSASPSLSLAMLFCTPCNDTRGTAQIQCQPSELDVTHWGLHNTLSLFFLSYSIPIPLNFSLLSAYQPTHFLSQCVTYRTCLLSVQQRLILEYSEWDM